MRDHIVGLLSLTAGASTCLAQLQGLGFLPFSPGTPTSAAAGVSDDGLVVTGSSSHRDPTYTSTPLTATFRWTQATGMQIVSQSPTATFGGGSRVSGDGSTIVGVALDWSGFTPAQQAMSFSAGSFTFIGDLPGNSFGSAAMDVSGNGQIVVGWGINAAADVAPFRWTTATGIQPLPALFPGHPPRGRAQAISTDGTTIVGYLLPISSPANRAVKWTSAGTVDLGVPSWAPTRSTEATCVSSDGSAIAGTVSEGPSTYNVAAFYWTSATGMVRIAAPAPYVTTTLRDMNSDGSMIVGTMSAPESQGRAMIWTPQDGVQDLNDVASARGISLGGWTLTTAGGVSADGLVIVGQGINPSGSAEAFVLQLPPPVVCGTSDYNGDGDFGTDADIEAFFACLGGNCCPTCWQGGSDFNGDGDSGTDSDIEAFFRVLGGGAC